MKKSKFNLVIILAIGIFTFFNVLAYSENIEFPNIYPQIVDRLIIYKNHGHKAFFGGPVTGDEKKIKWVMPFIFEDDQFSIKSIYDICFINCDCSSAENAKIVYLDTSDINIKFKNIKSIDFQLFSKLSKNEYTKDKYILIRESDVSMVYFPDIFYKISADKILKKDQIDLIASYLSKKFKTQKTWENCNIKGITLPQVKNETEDEINFVSEKITTNIDNEEITFYVTKKILKKDYWKVYYIITKQPLPQFIEYNKNNIISLRLDSGCVSGQIYDDAACDCLDQLHQTLKNLDNNSIVIHIPAHDGRGFGFAPKAETEIYKAGGKGCIHATKPLDTIAAAKFLYKSDNIDLRTYDGAAKIIKSLQIDKVILLTDNRKKVSSLQQNGIEVIRKATKTDKNSCLLHLKAKKESEYYF